MVINANAISELIKIEEKLDILLKNLVFPLDENTVNYIRMFLAKEDRIISEIPIDDKEFIDDVMDELENLILNNVYDMNNYAYIFSRLFTFFNDCSIKIKPESQFANVFDGQNFYVQDNYEDSDYNIKSREYFKNIMIRYLKSLDGLKCLGIYGDILFDIQKYNLFIERDLFSEYVDCNYNLDKMKDFSDSEMMIKFSLDKESFDDLKKDVIFSKLYEIIDLMFCNEKESMYYLDAELNFKHYLYELSYDSLVLFASMLDNFLSSYFQNSEKNIFDYKDIISLIKKYLDEELSRKHVDNLETWELSEEDYKRLSNFVFLEKEIINLIDNLNFEDNDLDSIKKLDSLLSLEDEMVSSFGDISILDLNIFFTKELSNIIDGEDSLKLTRLINDRIFHLLPVFNMLFKIPGQSLESFEIINRNYVISCLKKFYELVDEIDEEDAKDVFYKVYKEQFYRYPFLTNSLVSLNGNHLMIEPFSLELSFELSNIDEFEYMYDLNVQLFDEILAIIVDMSMFDSSIQDFDYAYFNLKIIQFNYICNYLNDDELEKVSNVLVDNLSDGPILDILYNIVQLNLNDTKYTINFDGSSIKVLTLGGV